MITYGATKTRLVEVQEIAQPFVKRTEAAVSVESVDNTMSIVSSS
jgi:hypothetical protein